jgi:uncharacterized protein YdhG (YjbR/CyaY superfamily)
MSKAKQNYKTIDAYIKTFPEDIQEVLQTIRQTIKKAAPESEEVISYKMPAFKQKSILVWFAAFKNHIGFFPKVNAIKKFEKELLKYETSKGTIRFPLDKKIPLGLISKITKFRVKEELEKTNKN